jgi:hypothetical protein
MPLSLGWRDSELLKQIDFDHNRQDATASELYTKYAVALAAEIPPIIEADLAWTAHNKYRVKTMTKPLLARLRFDPEGYPEFCASEDFHQSRRQGILPEAAGGGWRNDRGTGPLVSGRTRTSAIAQEPRKTVTTYCHVRREVSVCACLNRSQRHRDYMPSDLEPILKAQGIDKTVVVRTSPTVAETDFRYRLPKIPALSAALWAGSTWNLLIFPIS